MSMSSDGASGTLSRPEAPDYNATYTITGWFKATDASLRKGILSVFVTDDNNADEFATDFQTANRVYGMSSIGGAFTRVHGATVISNATWYFFVFRRTGATSLEWRIDTTSQGTVTNDVTGRTAADTVLVFDGKESVNDFVGSMCQVRVWTTNLSDGELVTEKGSVTVVKAGSWASWPMANATDNSDESGNGRNLTITGTFTTDSDNPPGQGGGGPTVDQEGPAFQAELASGGMVGVNHLRT